MSMVYRNFFYIPPLLIGSRRDGIIHELNYLSVNEDSLSDPGSAKLFITLRNGNSSF